MESRDRMNKDQTERMEVLVSDLIKLTARTHVKISKSERKLKQLAERLYALEQQYEADLSISPPPLQTIAAE